MLHRSRKYQRQKANNNQIRKFKAYKKTTRPSKCKCYICGEIGHYAREHNSKNVNRARLHIYQELDLEQDWDIVSLDNGEDLNDSNIFSYSDNKTDQIERSQILISDSIIMVLNQTYYDWNLIRATKRLTQARQDCTHTWNRHPNVDYINNICFSFVISNLSKE